MEELFLFLHLFLLLLQEQFPEGWQEYECRLKTKELGGLMRNFVQSKWEGEPLEGRTILLQAEQGIGDVVARAVKVVRVKQVDSGAAREKGGCGRGSLVLQREG
jgi:hypothetical protein